MEVLNHNEIKSLSDSLSARYYFVHKELVYEAIYDALCIYIDNCRKKNSINIKKRIPYIYKTAKNQLINYIKEANKAKKYEYKIFDRIYNNKDTISSDDTYYKNINILAEAAGNLSILELEIIYWHYYYEMQLKQFALKKGLSYVALRKQHERLIKKLIKMCSPSRKSCANNI